MPTSAMGTSLYASYLGIHCCSMCWNFKFSKDTKWRSRTNETRFTDMFAHDVPQLELITSLWQSAAAAHVNSTEWFVWCWNAMMPLSDSDDLQAPITDPGGRRLVRAWYTQAWPSSLYGVHSSSLKLFFSYILSCSFSSILKEKRREKKTDQIREYHIL